MRPVLIDTGVLVALLDRGDDQHERCVTALKDLPASLLTSWPVVTEAMYLLGDVAAGQDALLTWIEASTPSVAELNLGDIPSIRAMMAKYRDVPMDFADASLVCLAQRLALEVVFTLDRDFHTYRLAGRSRFKVIPAGF